MKIMSLHKKNLSCACGCGHKHERLDLVNKMNGKYFKLYCGRIYRLHTESIRWIRSVAFG